MQPSCLTELRTYEPIIAIREKKSHRLRCALWTYLAADRILNMMDGSCIVWILSWLWGGANFTVLQFIMRIKC